MRRQADSRVTMFLQRTSSEDNVYASMHSGMDEPTTTTTTTTTTTDPFEDVFGPDNEQPSQHDAADRSAAHPSDMSRLEQQHVTAGYRDGVTAAKAASIQAGFDEGFGLGATVGLRAGELLGVLEGIAQALRVSGDDDDGGAAAASERRLADARRELGARAVFAPEYWAADGTWRYEVAAAAGGAGEVVFADVAAAHPLIRKWRDVVDGEMARWAVDRAVLAGISEEGRETPPETTRGVGGLLTKRAAGPLDW
jgi:hypothetical protein